MPDVLDEMVMNDDVTAVDAAHAVPSYYFLTNDLHHLKVTDEVGPLDSEASLQVLAYEIATGLESKLSPIPWPERSVWITPLEAPAVAPLTTIVSELRALLDLPVQDVARMCGIQRRQFYNLLSGDTARSDHERHIRTLHQAIEDIADAVGSDADQVRAAVLMPISDEYESFFDIAVADDEERLREAARRLVDRLRSGDRAGMLPRPSPTLQRLQTDRSARAAQEALRDHAERSGVDGQ